MGGSLRHHASASRSTPSVKAPQPSTSRAPQPAEPSRAVASTGSSEAAVQEQALSQAGHLGHRFDASTPVSSPPGAPIQRVKLKSSGGKEVEVPEHLIIDSIHKRVLNTMKADDTDPPRDPFKLDGYKAGYPRPFKDAKDAYSLIREARGAPKHMWKLQHGDDPEDYVQFGHNTNLSTNDAESDKVSDNVVRPGGTPLPKELEGHRYSQIGASMLKMAELRGGSVTAKNVAADHIRMMKGNPLQALDGDEPDKEQKARMAINNAIMFVAEGRRDVGMLPISFMALHNLKHAEDPATEAVQTMFGKVIEKEKKKGVAKGTKRKKGAAKEKELGTHPAAFSGSKSGLQSVEQGIDEAGSLKTTLKNLDPLKGGAKRPKLGSATASEAEKKRAKAESKEAADLHQRTQTVAGNMETMVKEFFKGKWADLSRDKYKDFLNADFDETQPEKAAEAAADIVHHKFLKKIPRFGNPAKK
jgi:hypothetical protein